MTELKVYKRQWSIKLDNGEIYVAQEDTTEELGLAIEEIKSKLLGKPTVVAEKAAIQQYSEAQEQEDEHWCSVHSVSLEKRFSEKKQKWYYGHNIEGSKLLCFGK